MNMLAGLVSVDGMFMPTNRLSLLIMQNHKVGDFAYHLDCLDLYPCGTILDPLTKARMLQNP